MTRAFCTALLGMFAATAVAAAPANWPDVGKDVYLVPASVDRFGNTLHFAVAQPNPAGKWSFSWRWAHCQKPWMSDMTAIHFSDVDSPQEAFAEASVKQDKFFTAQIDFQSIASPPFGDGTALRKQLSARCRSDAQSQEGIELPIAGPPRKLGRESYSEYLLLRTIARRGEVAEGWMRRRPILREEFKGADGKVLRKENGDAWTRDVFTAQDTSARFKVTANCAQRLIALSRYVEYDKDGNVSFQGRDDPKLSYSEPIPGTVGETYLDVLCRL